MYVCIIYEFFMCGTYTWLDLFCWSLHGDLVNVVFFFEHCVRIYHYLREKTLLLSVPICTQGQFRGKLDFSEKLPEVPRKVHFHLVIN